MIDDKWHTCWVCTADIRPGVEHKYNPQGERHVCMGCWNSGKLEDKLKRLSEMADEIGKELVKYFWHGIHTENRIPSKEDVVTEIKEKFKPLVGEIGMSEKEFDTVVREMVGERLK